MNLNTSVPVRFDDQQTLRLQEMSQRSGIPVSQLIRFAVEAWLDKYEKAGRMIIPLRPGAGQYPAVTARAMELNEKPAKRAKPREQ